MAPREDRESSDAAMEEEQEKPRKLVDSEEEDEEDALEDERAKSAKKRRLTSADSEDEEEGNAPAEEDDEIPALPADAAPKRDHDGYVVGSIVRIACDNFLTYDSVEVYPGPYLNMICGPNGAGKSTIVSAIAIGLGFPTSILGRSNKLSQFANDKTDRSDVWVEIELKTGTKKNLVVKRTFTRKNDSSQFYIDNKKVSLQTVTDKVAELNVQVNNLCSFLPQEKVASFANLNSKDLLIETMKTAGHPKLLEWRNYLSEQKKSLTAKAKAVADNKETLAKLEEKNRNADRDIERYKERQEVDNEIKIWEAIKPWVEYKPLKADYDQKKNVQKEAQKAYDELETANAPIIAQKALLQKLVDSTENDRKKHVSRQEKNDGELRAHSRTLGETETNANRLREQLTELASEDKRRLENIERLEKEVTRLERAVENAPAKTDASELNEHLAQANQRMREAADAHAEISNRFQAIQAEMGRYRQEIGNAERHLQDLENASKQREHACRGQDPKLWNAVCWLRENSDKFQGQVWEPARLTVSIKDRRCASQIESLIPGNLFRTVVCEKYEDYDYISTALNDTHNLRVNVVQLPADKRSLAAYPTPMPEEQLRQTFGFDGFAISQLEGPEEMLAYLCGAAYIHMRAYCVGRQPINREAIERRDCPIRDYATADQRVTVRFSNYGARNSQVQSSSLGQAKVLTSAIDPEQKAAAEHAHKEATAQFNDAKERLGALQPEDARLREVITAAKNEKQEINQRKLEMQAAERNYAQAQTRLQTKKRELDAARAKPSADDKRDDLRKRLRKAAQNRVKAAQAVANAVSKSVAIQNDITISLLEHVQAQADLAAIEIHLREQNATLIQAQEALEEAQNALDASKRAASLVYNEAQTMIQEIEKTNLIDRFHEYRTAHGDKPASVVEDKLDELQVRLSQCPQIPPALIAEYESRKQAIARMKTQIEHEMTNVDQVRQRIQRTHDKFHPALQALATGVSRTFTAFFADLGLNGEVVLVDKPADYDQWELQILVAFRDGLSLQILTAHRQSGGERALSTIAFILSLIQLARAPFSLVDEINQGMDKRVERAVHNQLVRITCSDKCGQYFLLTPKLLDNLHYHDRMKVLVIHNGPWMPEGSFPVHEVIKRQLERRRAETGQQKLIATAA